jgi:hypothetical protein
MSAPQMSAGQMLDMFMNQQAADPAAASSLRHGASLGERLVVPPLEQPRDQVVREVPRAVPTEVEVIREVPKEVIREVIKEVIKEVPVEVRRRDLRRCASTQRRR